jgi:hypothetical protein
MTRYRYALVNVNRVSDFDKAPILKMNTALVDRCCATKLVGEAAPAPQRKFFAIRTESPAASAIS